MEEITLNLPFLIAGVIIFIGFFGTIFFKKTSIPDILFLILIGALIGPILGWVKVAQLENITPYFGRLALIIILFEGGLHIDFGVLVRHLVGGLGIAIGVFAVSVFGVWLAGVYLLEMSHLNAFIFACIVGGISPAIVIPLVKEIKVQEETRILLNLESVLADIFIILSVIILMEIALKGEISPANILNKIAGSFSIAFVAGVIAGFIWIKALGSVKIAALSYMTTLAAVLVLYGLVEMSKGSGAVAAFTFGLMLRNGTRFLRIFDENKAFKLDDKIEQFHAEFAFFIRTYFFVYLGLLITPVLFQQDNILLSALLVTGIIILVRFAFVYLFSAVYKPLKIERLTYVTMLPRGLATAVVATLPAASKIAGTENFVAYTILVILMTNVFMVFGIFVSKRQAVCDPRPEVLAENQSVNKSIQL